MVKTLRLDVDQICDQIRASIETKLPNKKAHLRRDGKGRIKERIHTVFAVTEVEYRKSKIRLNQSKHDNNGAAKKGGRLKPNLSAKPPSRAPKASTGAASLQKRISAPTTNHTDVILNELPNKTNVFHIPV